MILVTFGERFKQLRNEKNLTQEQLANKFFLNKSSISRYERDKQVPEIDLLQKFADFFEVSLDYLLGRTNNRSEVLIDTQEKADDIADEIIDILIETGELSKEELQSGKIDPEKKKKLLLKVKKAIKASQIFEEE